MPAGEIFISYAKEDSARAAELASVLESKGWSVWWDRQIPPGRTFDEVIEEALTNARCVIVLWSASSVASRWVRTEASVADERGNLVPALIEDVPIPLEFRRLQAARLIDWHGEPGDDELGQLLDTVGRLVSGGPAQAPAPRPAARRGFLRMLRIPQIAIPLVAFAAGSAITYLTLFRSTDPGPAQATGKFAPESHDWNVKAFELLVGNEGPTGRFESLGTFETKNLRQYPSPWQEFTFPAARAKFFKVRVISTFTGFPYAVVREWRLLGSF